MYMWLKFSRKILLSVLQNHPLAAVTTPTEIEIEEYIAAVAKKYPVLEQHKVWDAADGLKYRWRGLINGMFKKDSSMVGPITHMSVVHLSLFLTDGSESVH